MTTRKRPLVHLSLSPEAIARLAEIATRIGETRSGIVERLIRECEMPPVISELDNLKGVLADAERDLATSLASGVREKARADALEAELGAERARTDALVAAIEAMRDEDYDAAWDSRMRDAVDAVARARKRETAPKPST